MPFGFEVRDTSGDILLSSDSVAYVFYDSFAVTGYTDGSRAYSQLLPGMTLKADYLIEDISWSTRASTAVANRLVDGWVDVYAIGNTVYWEWKEPNNEGWDFSKITIRVFAA